MYAIKKTTDVKKILINVSDLQEMLCVGKNTAYQIGKDAGAVCRIGKRMLFNVEKINAYINALTDEQN